MFAGRLLLKKRILIGRAMTTRPLSLFTLSLFNGLLLTAILTSTLFASPRQIVVKDRKLLSTLTLGVANG